MSEIDDLETTLIHVPDFAPQVDLHQRDRVRMMHASPHRGKTLRQRLEDDFNEVLRHPPE